MTGEEMRASGSFATCQSCHMPKADGVTDHSMAGGYSADMVRRGVVMSINANVDGERIKAKLLLTNKLPHAFPTGAPFRHMVVKVRAYDKEGQLLWENFKTNPAAEDPQSAFHYVLGNDQDQIAQPPAATKVLANTRLKPNETRELSYDIPATKVAVVRAEALYNVLAPPPHCPDGRQAAEGDDRPQGGSHRRVLALAASQGGRSPPCSTLPGAAGTGLPVEGCGCGLLPHPRFRALDPRQFPVLPIGGPIAAWLRANCSRSRLSSST
ncbi:MAG: hypothetical protein MZW92_49605 [Comamonadaceae bacterium]|nr:hypothetical protein [Comamonadaceae bacterium]